MNTMRKSDLVDFKIADSELKSSRFVTLLSGIFFFTALSIIYFLEISSHFLYMGFARDFSGERLILSVSILFLFPFIIKESNDVVTFFHKFIYFLYICPALVYFYIGNPKFDFIVYVMAGIFCCIFFSRVQLQILNIASLSKKQILVIMLLMAFTAIFTIIAFGGWKSFNLNPMRVYDFRFEAAAGVPTIFSYINSPVSKVVLPIGVMLSLHYRSRWSVVLFIGLTILMYGLTSHKSVLVAPFLILFIHTVLTRYGLSICINILFFLIGFIGIIEFCFYYVLDIEDAGVFTTFVIRRVFFVPPLIDSYYIEFFSNNPFTHWSDSRISMGLVTSPYDATAPFLIGENFFGRASMSANTGFIGSGFANFGLAGVLIYGTLIGLTLSLLNSHGRQVGHFVVISASITVMVTAFTSADFITVFLTHGLLFLLILLSLMPHKVGEK